jgi:ribosomal protein S12 methylthiotransferase accessory factor
VAAARETPLVTGVRSELAQAGIELAGPGADGALVLADLSGLSVRASRELVRTLHLERHRSLSVWRRGAETFFGPWAEPLRTACWNCCLLRFSDTLAPGDSDLVEADAATTRAVAENVVLAVRYPQLTAYGCVVADDGFASALHSVLPMPWCEVCGGAAELTAFHSASATQSVVVPEDVRVLADTRGGIVRRLLVFAGDSADAPALPVSASALVGGYRQGAVWRPAFTGEGKGATRESAVRSAIGEGIERYSASLWDPASLTRASLNQLDKHAFDPRWLVLYEDTQYAQPDFPFVPFDPDLPLYWAQGTWLDSGKRVQLPAIATYMHFPADAAERFAQTTSNGLAAGTTFEDAALRALYELIERDAFMLFWLARRPALRIAENGGDPVTRRALLEVERLGARTELYLLDAGTEHPTVVCLGLGDGRSWPGATIGLCAHADIGIAVQRAVLEHGHAGAYIRRLMLEGRHEGISSTEQVVTGLDHALYYVPPARAAALEPLRSGTERPATVAELRSRYRQEASLAACAARLRDAGVRAAVVDVTSPDVALAPLRVVRAFGTYMQPIDFGTANRRLKSPRLEALLSGRAATEPHPLA